MKNISFSKEKTLERRGRAFNKREIKQSSLATYNFNYHIRAPIRLSDQFLGLYLVIMMIRFDIFFCFRILILHA